MTFVCASGPVIVTNVSMRKIKLLLVCVGMSAIAACFFSCSKKSGPQSATRTVKAVDSNWVFRPMYMNPQVGQSAPVTDRTFRVLLSNDSLDVYLPYLGRAYAGADIFSGKGPLNFTSSKFTTSLTQKKKDRRELAITPDDNNEVRSMNFTLFNSGRANLVILMRNRSSINFSGTVRNESAG